MSSIMNRMGGVLVCLGLSMGAATLACAEAFEISFDPLDGMGGGDWEPGALASGSDMEAVNSVYGPEFGIEFGEHELEAGDGTMGECCDGNYFLNMGTAEEGRLHWFVNALDQNYFPAGTTISVSWNNNTGGPSALKAYADSIPADMASIDNANDGAAFGGLVGEVTHGPEQYATLDLELTADARSFTVHQSALDFENDSSFITGEIDGEPVAPNVSINGMNYELEFVADVGLAGDYNEDGTVNAADYTVWRDTLGSTDDLRADGDDSSAVDSGDYAIWKSNFGNTNTPGAAAGALVASVPEPGTTALLAVWFAIAAFSWPTRSRNSR